MVDQPITSAEGHPTNSRRALKPYKQPEYPKNRQRNSAAQKSPGTRSRPDQHHNEFEHVVAPTSRIRYYHYAAAFRRERKTEWHRAIDTGHELPKHTRPSALMELQQAHMTGLRVRLFEYHVTPGCYQDRSRTLKKLLPTQDSHVETWSWARVPTSNALPHTSKKFQP